VNRRGPISHQGASANANNRDLAGDGVQLSGASGTPSGRLGFQVRGFDSFPNSVIDSAHFISFFLACSLIKPSELSYVPPPER
jgi:hypothetical protein